MDDTGAPVVKIDARWSPQNVYVIDGKALSLDGFVKRSLGSTAAHFAEELPRPLLIEGAAEEARWHLDGGFMEILEPADF